MKKIFSLIFAGGLTISGLSAQEKLNVLYVGGSANIETFGKRVSKKAKYPLVESDI